MSRGREVVHRLIADFDIFVTNARPGVPERIGVDYETLRRHRPDLIYLHVTGFGDPNQVPAGALEPGRLREITQRAGSDVIVQAYSGLLAADEKVDRHGAPEPITATAPADWVAAFGGAMGVCAALFHRQRSGEGQYLTTSLLAAALTLQAPWLASVPPSDAFLVQPLLDRFAELRDAGASYAELIEARREAPRQTRAFRLYYGGYPVKDGAIILGALTPANRKQIRRALEITDDPTERDDFNALAPESGPIVERVRSQIAELMLSATMEEWMERFDAEGAPASKVRLPEEMNLDPELDAMGLLRPIEHALTGPERHVGPLVNMSATPTGTDRPSPPLDAHTDEVLREHDFSEGEIAGASRRGGDRCLRGWRGRGWGGEGGPPLPAASPPAKPGGEGIREGHLPLAGRGERGSGAASPPVRGKEDPVRPPWSYAAWTRAWAGAVGAGEARGDEGAWSCEVLALSNSAVRRLCRWLSCRRSTRVRGRCGCACTRRPSTRLTRFVRGGGRAEALRQGPAALHPGHGRRGRDRRDRARHRDRPRNRRRGDGDGDSERQPRRVSREHRAVGRRRRSCACGRLARRGLDAADERSDGAAVAGPAGVAAGSDDCRDGFGGLLRRLHGPACQGGWAARDRRRVSQRRAAGARSGRRHRGAARRRHLRADQEGRAGGG